MMEFAVEMIGITKTFPGTVANDNVSLRVRKGEIHALLGENGAGKSTLMNILFGLYQPDDGEIHIHGQKVRIDNPNAANRLGIGMVHQHFMLVEPFTVTENIILGTEPGSGWKIERRKAEQEVARLSEMYGLKIDPQAKIEDLTVGQQQRVEILKTLYRGADILIFDEPTAVLTPQEIKELIEIMKMLIGEGKTIILITHKLKEIMEACDSVSILRRGKMVGPALRISETNPDELAARMVGREVHFSIDKAAAAAGDLVLSLRNVHAVGNRGLKSLEGVNLDVHRGEIVGIAGVEGNGQTELIEVITGLRKIQSGEIRLHGERIDQKKPRQIVERKVSHIPEDRHKRGLVLDFTVSENIALMTYYTNRFISRGLLDYEKMDTYARKLIQEYDVRTSSEHVPVRGLSGGNQQKAIIAREIDRNPDLLIAAQPTRGLDVGAIEFIHRKLIEQRDNRKAVLLVSLELDEVIKLSDRIAVIYEGKIAAVVDPKSADEQELGRLMAGAGRKMKEDKHV